MIVVAPPQQLSYSVVVVVGRVAERAAGGVGGALNWKRAGHAAEVPDWAQIGEHGYGGAGGNESAAWCPLT